MAISTSRESNSLDAVQEHPQLASLAAELLWRAGNAESVRAFVHYALPLLQSAAGADFAALCEPADGQWQIVQRSGAARPLPTHLLADALDHESARAADGWVAAPIEER